MSSTEMKSYLSLIPISAKVRRRQNRMTILCIVLAVFLVTGGFSMGEKGVRGEKKKKKKKKKKRNNKGKGTPPKKEKNPPPQEDVAAFSAYSDINASPYGKLLCRR